jgi:hypothetical protein
MPCENYREALIEAAAADSAPSTELRSHLDACASCRAAFTEEQQLFAAIDTGVRLTANAEVPPSFLQRLSARLEAAPSSQRRWTSLLVYAAASAAIVVTVFIAARPRHAINDAEAKQVLRAPIPETPVRPAGEHVAGSRNTVTAIRSYRVPQPRDSHSPGSVTSTGLEVIVPPDEREAFVRFVSTRKERGDVAIAVVAPAAGHEDAPLSVEPLLIAKLEVTPLEQLESSAPDNTQEEQ